MIGVRPFPALALPLALLAALRLGFWLGAFPNPDEAYYWLWGQHWNLSYFDHPPLQAWGQGAFTALLGRSNWTLRLPNLISNGLLLGLYAQICHDLYGGRRGVWKLTVLLLFTSPLFFLFLAFAWHDHWLVLFATTASYCLMRFLHRYPTGASWGWLYAATLCLGITALCKYLAVFLALGMVAAIVSYRPWRPLLWDGRFWGGIAIALLVASPVLVWNAQNDWASFNFYLGRSVGAQTSQIRWGAPLEFLLLTGIIFGPIHSWATAQVLRQGLGAGFGNTYRRVAIAIFLVSTGCLSLLALKAPVLYYWNILAYPLLIPLMTGLFISAPSANHRSRYRGGLRAAQIIGIGAIAILLVHFTLVPLSALIGVDGDEDSRMLFGWKTIGSRIQTEAVALGTDAPLLLTTDYRSASALAYQLREPEVMAISGRRDQFDLWYDAAAMEGRDALLLGDNWHPICPTHEAMFDTTETLDPITISRFGIFIKRYTLIRGHNFHAGPNDRYPLSPEYPLAFTGDGQTCQ